MIITVLFYVDDSCHWDHDQQHLNRSLADNHHHFQCPNHFHGLIDNYHFECDYQSLEREKKINPFRNQQTNFAFQLKSS